MKIIFLDIDGVLNDGSGLDLSILGHGYFAQAHGVLYDMLTATSAAGSPHLELVGYFHRCGKRPQLNWTEQCDFRGGPDEKSWVNSRKKPQE